MEGISQGNNAFLVNPDPVSPENVDVSNPTAPEGVTVLVDNESQQLVQVDELREGSVSSFGSVTAGSPIYERSAPWAGITALQDESTTDESTQSPTEEWVEVKRPRTGI